MCKSVTHARRGHHCLTHIRDGVEQPLVAVHDNEQTADHHGVHVRDEPIQLEDVVDVLTRVLLVLSVQMD